MGADLYIQSIANTNRKTYDALFDKAVKDRNNYYNNASYSIRKAIDANKDSKYIYLQSEVDKYYTLSSGGDGYFRCSYGYNFFTNIGLSWWQDFGKLLDDKNMLSIDAAIDIAEALGNTTIQTPTIETLKENYCIVDDGDNSPEAWTKYLEEHKQEFINFLERAIALNEPIYCSI